MTDDSTMMNETETVDEFEARMIARFNKKVNQPEPSSHQTVSNIEKKNVQNSAVQEKTLSETGGPKGLEPTRYGDWEAKGRCHDF